MRFPKKQFYFMHKTTKIFFRVFINNFYGNHLVALCKSRRNVTGVSPTGGYAPTGDAVVTGTRVWNKLFVRCGGRI